MRRPLFAIVALLVVPALLSAGDKNNKESGQSSVIKFVVLKDDNGKQAKGGFELKTDAEGRTETDGIPYGLMRIQVIAPGFQTFGDDFTINQAEQVVTIRLKRPRDQYTIYDKPGSSQPKDKQ
jgi:hypothetical protein